MSFVQAKPISTHNFYGPIHKGLRLRLSQLLVQLGACDGDDPEALAQLIADLRGQCHISEHHLSNEDSWIHPALEKRAPGSTVRLVRDHEHHRRTFEEIEELIGRVETADDARRDGWLRALYLRFSTFVAEDFAHMAEEEQLILPILQSLFTDEELISIEDKILSGLSPDQMVAFGRFMIPAATRRDRITLLSAIRATAPAEAFAAIIELSAKPTLSEADFSHLWDGLGLAA